MNYYAAIKQQYPNAIFSLQDDGHGVYIAKWEDTNDKPELHTLTELATTIQEAAVQEDAITSGIDPVLLEQLKQIFVLK
jgi:hypothetical protein